MNTIKKYTINLSSSGTLNQFLKNVFITRIFGFDKYNNYLVNTEIGIKFLNTSPT